MANETAARGSGNVRGSNDAGNGSDGNGSDGTGGRVRGGGAEADGSGNKRGFDGSGNDGGSNDARHGSSGNDGEGGKALRNSGRSAGMCGAATAAYARGGGGGSGAPSAAADASMPRGCHDAAATQGGCVGSSANSGDGAVKGGGSHKRNSGEPPRVRRRACRQMAPQPFFPVPTDGRHLSA
eukprot:306477-Chlamydomonas_euryale.AAC.1